MSPSALDIPKRWPLISRLQVRSTSAVLPLTKDARLVNGFAEFDPEDNAYWIYKRPGLSQVFAPTGTSPVGVGIDSGSNNNDAYFIINSSGTDRLYSVAGAPGGAAGVAISAIANPPQYWFQVLNDANNTVVFSSGINGVGTWQWNSVTGLTRIDTIANYPANNNPGFAYLNGTLYVMSGNSIFGSANLDSALTWSALNVIKASSQADGGVALTKHLSYVVALKQNTTQVFYDTGTGSPGSTLAPVPDAQIPLGCLNPYSVRHIDDNLFWLSSNESTSPQVVQMENLTPRVVSTPAVEKILSNVAWNSSGSFGGGNSVFSWTLKHAGHRFYGITVPTSQQAVSGPPSNQITLVYDIDQKLWYIWTDFQGNYWPIVGMSFIPINTLSGFLVSGANQGFHVALHRNGNLYILDLANFVPTDFGNVFPVEIYTPNFDAGTTRKKFLHSMFFVADRVNTKLLARFSDDDYTTWSNFREIDLSRKKPMMVKCGTFDYRRAYHFRHQAPTQFRIKAVELQMDIGTL